MKNILLLGFILVLSGCRIYKPYIRQDVVTDNLYGAAYETNDTANIANIPWQEMFPDTLLQQLIDRGLANNTDMQSACWRIQEAEAALKTARLAYLPSFNFGPNGSVSSFDNKNTSWAYTVPVTASWEIDIFARLTNANRQAKSLYRQSRDYKQAVRTGLIANVADHYYTLLMLDEQLHISEETLGRYKESIRTLQAMKKAGMADEAAVAQMEAAYFAVGASLQDLKRSLTETENSLCSLLGETPHPISRSRLENQIFSCRLKTGLPVQLLANRPDIRAAEESLAQAYYATNIARAALYPSLTLSGTGGWTNSLGEMVVNPGKLLLSAAGALFQPIFNNGNLRGRIKIAKAQQEEAKLAFRQALLNAGEEVNNALTQCQTASAKTEWRTQQIESLETAVTKTRLLMQYGSTTYLDVLTAQQSLLQAQLAQAADRYEAVQGIINLYHALGGGTTENDKE